MSARRKNAKRLKQLRARGIGIDGDYLVPSETLERLGILDDCLELGLDPPIARRYVPVPIQRAVLVLMGQPAVA
jgi:hypothetical protein